jgi:capsular exopolysaccharide synthesis family protein
MSRIDEALRRAAQNAQDRADQGTDDLVTGEELTAESANLAVLSREPFPIEMAGRTAGAPRTRGRLAPPPTHADAFSREHETPGPEDATPGVKAKNAHAGTGETRPAAAAPLFERIDHTLAEKVVADANMSSISREQYRRLAAVLHDAQTNSGLSVVMIASAVSGEGKTLTASNLALTLSESYHKRVLLIDADLRKPTLHQVFRINSALGLSTGLAGGRDAKLTVHQVSPRLSVLPAGRPTTDPMAGLISERMQQLIDEAKQAFDWVIIDTPPVVLLPDANLLAAMVQGTVLVIRANSTPHNLVKRAVEAIGPQRIIGTVLNQAATTVGAGYGSYYHYGSGHRYLPREEAATSA